MTTPPLTETSLDLAPETELFKDLHTNLMFLNMGPAHPAAHGTLRTFAALDGETVRAAVCEIGYLHRGFEKTVEHRTWTQVIPYTDRLNYCSAALNNFAFCKVVEKALDLQITPRAAAIRVIVGELMRIIDHLTTIGPNILDMGAMTTFWYTFNQREKVYDVLDKLCGARLTNSYGRIGGLYRDFYEGAVQDILYVLKETEDALIELEALIRKNKIFIDRAKDVCPFTPEQAISYGFTGPNLRACGVDWDLRKATPYWGYEQYDFEVAIGTTGDTWDRLMVRFVECYESMKIIRQALKTLPGGGVNVDDKRVTLPPKRDTYQNIEGLINHFKLIFEGIRVPQGEYYDAIEAANGELGFFIVSDGTGHPYRVRVRPPSFFSFSAYPELIEGSPIADAIACLGSINIIAGELDR